MILTACAPNTIETVRTVSDYCLLASGITFSKIKDTQKETDANKFDTDETVAQIEKHDLTYERICNATAVPEATKTLR